MTGYGSALRRRLWAMRIIDLRVDFSAMEPNPIAKHAAKLVVVKPMDKPKPV